MADSSCAADGDSDDRIKRPNGNYGSRVDVDVDPSTVTSGGGGGGSENLVTLLRSFVAGVASHGHGAGDPSSPPPSIIYRVRSSFGKTAPRLCEASANSARDLHQWTRSGSPLRAIFVISAGTITLLALTGLLAFMFFLLVATSNAIILSLLMSLAAAGGFFAIFFACLVAIYVGAVSVAFTIIITTTISTIIAAVIATGWIGFFWTVWVVVKKSFDFTKQSASMTTSALSAYAAARHARHTSKSD